MKFIVFFFAFVAVVICEEVCEDKGSDCKSMKPEDCINPCVYERCAKSCHLCGKCEDSRPDCEFLRKRGDCDKMDSSICRKSCGICGQPKCCLC